MNDVSQSQGWWQATDGHWYPPTTYGVPETSQASPAAPSTNGLAITSMVLGILWIWWIGSILALVFGYVAKRQIRDSAGLQQGGGMATAGIVLGWIGSGVLALIVVLVIIGAAAG